MLEVLLTPLDAQWHGFGWADVCMAWRLTLCFAPGHHLELLVFATLEMWQWNAGNVCCYGLYLVRQHAVQCAQGMLLDTKWQTH